MFDLLWALAEEEVGKQQCIQFKSLSFVIVAKGDMLRRIRGAVDRVHFLKPIPISCPLELRADKSKKVPLLGCGLFDGLVVKGIQQ